MPKRKLWLQWRQTLSWTAFLKGSCRKTGHAGTRMLLVLPGRGQSPGGPRRRFRPISTEGRGGGPGDSVGPVVGLLLRCQWHRAAAPLAVARRLAVAGST